MRRVYSRKKHLTGATIDGLNKDLRKTRSSRSRKVRASGQRPPKASLASKKTLSTDLFSTLRTAKSVAAIRKGIGHSLLNAKHHEREAMIIAQAGRKGAVTVSTNMAGRGTDILLGGNAEYLAKEKLLKEFPETPSVNEDPAQIELYEQRVKDLTKEFKAQTDAERDEEVSKVSVVYM